MATDSEWIWDGGRVCLDFVNTLRHRWTNSPGETLREPDDLVRWLQTASLLSPDTAKPATTDGLASGRRLREAIDRAVLTMADGRLPTSGDVTLLNRSAAAAPRPVLQLVIVDQRLEPVGTADVTNDPAVSLALLAQDAADLLLSADIRHVRVCGADHCALRFLDRSPARNRRWCSMSRCGNRSKVRLHQARARLGERLTDRR